MNAIVRDSNKWQEVLRRINMASESQQDATINTKRMRYVGDSTLILPAPLEAGYKSVQLTKHAKEQLFSEIDLPSAYLRTIEETNPALANEVINDRLQTADAKKFWRFSESRVRAVLPERVEPVPNVAIVNAMDKYIGSDADDFVIRSVSLDDDRFYLKVLFDQEYRDQTGITKGNYLKVGVVTRTSETNHGEVMVKPFIYRWSCTNDAIVAGNIAFTGSARSLSLSAITEGVSSVVAYARLEASNLVNNLLEAQTDVVRKPRLILEKIGAELGMTDTNKRHLIASYNKEPMPTRYGIIQALTQYAQMLELDNRSRVESYAGSLATEWPATL